MMMMDDDDYDDDGGGDDDRYLASASARFWSISVAAGSPRPSRR